MLIDVHCPFKKKVPHPQSQSS